MDEFIFLAKTLLSLVNNYSSGQILSWMIESWMKGHWVSDNNRNIVKSIIPKKIHKE